MFEMFRCIECGTKIDEESVNRRGYRMCRRCQNVDGCPSQCDAGTLYKAGLAWPCASCDAGADVWMPLPYSGHLWLEELETA